MPSGLPPLPPPDGGRPPATERGSRRAAPPLTSLGQVAEHQLLGGQHVASAGDIEPQDAHPPGVRRRLPQPPRPLAAGAEATGEHGEAEAVQAQRQQVPEAAVAAGDEHGPAGRFQRGRLPPPTARQQQQQRRQRQQQQQQERGRGPHAAPPPRRADPRSWRAVAGPLYPSPVATGTAPADLRPGEARRLAVRPAELRACHPPREDGKFPTPGFLLALR